MFDDDTWQMSWGERAAVEGVLSQLRPALAVEIGSMEGASLRRIAQHAGEVHSFDLRPPTLEQPDNVRVHTGNSHELLPRVLAELEHQDRDVEFALVDGDHSADGVRQDIEDLLNSRALARAVILIHDTANEEVRRGVDAVRFSAWPKVAHVELDWIPGRLFAEAGLRNELWYGLGLVLVDAARLAYDNGAVYEWRYHPAAPLLAQIRDLVLARERLPAEVDAVEGAQDRVALLEAELGSRLSATQRALAAEAQLAAQEPHLQALETELGQVRRERDALLAELEQLRSDHEWAQQAIQDITGSASWRVTEPLRSAKRLVRPRTR